MELSNITVLIPAHNRPRHLKRLLNYYCKTEIQILVADSSSQPFLEAGDYPGIIYKHQPNMHFLRKVYDVLPLINTPYVVYCADDDFIVPEAIYKIVSFLNENLDYTTAQGHFLTFEQDEKKLEFYPRYIRNFTKKMDSETARGRLAQYVDVYASMLYSVCRTPLFKDMYSKAIDHSHRKPFFENLYLAEEFFNIYTLIHGKHITIPVFYAARERIKGSAASTTKPLKELIPEYSHEYKQFLQVLVPELALKDKISESEAYKFLDNFIQTQKVNPALSLKKKIINWVDEYSITKWLSKMFMERYKLKARKLVKGMESYPLNVNTPEKEVIIQAIQSRE